MTNWRREAYFESALSDALDRIADLEQAVTDSGEREEKALYVVNDMWAVFKKCAPKDARAFADVTPELVEIVGAEYVD